MTRIEVAIWMVVLAVCVGLLLGGNRSAEVIALLILAPLLVLGHAWVGSWFR